MLAISPLRVHMIRSWQVPFLFLVLALTSPASAEPCREIHGRALYFSGDNFLQIWHIGTHHTFFVVDDKSTDMIMKYIPYPDDGKWKALFADFTICPTEKFIQGASLLSG